MAYIPFKDKFPRLNRDANPHISLDSTSSTSSKMSGSTVATDVSSQYTRDSLRSSSFEKETRKIDRRRNHLNDGVHEPFTSDSSTTASVSISSDGRLSPRSPSQSSVSTSPAPKVLRNDVTSPRFKSVCPRCKTTHGIPVEVEQHISDLESQVKALASKASIAVNELTEHLEKSAQIDRLNEGRNSNASSNGTTSSNNSVVSSATSVTSTASAIVAFLTGKPGGASEVNSSEAITGNGTNIGNGSNVEVTNKLADDLRARLAREQELRASAETQVTILSRELEDLSAALFQQANEMVARERKERADLEERVRILELRDKEKRKRLDQLEKAVLRIDRVRKFIGEKG